MTTQDRLLDIRKIITSIPLHQWMLKTFHKAEITTGELCDLVIWDEEQPPNCRLSPEQRTELEMVNLRPEWVQIRRLDHTIGRLTEVMAGLTSILEQAQKIKGALPSPAKPKA